jgi:hypothetical protein
MEAVVVAPEVNERVGEIAGLDPVDPGGDHAGVADLATGLERAEGPAAEVGNHRSPVGWRHVEAGEDAAGRGPQAREHLGEPIQEAIQATHERFDGRGRPHGRSGAEIPIEEKDNYAWLVGLRDVTTIAGDMPQTRLVVLMDREADFFELFDAWRQDPRSDLLVRAKHNRRTTEELNLFDGIRAAQPRHHLVIHVGRQSARPKRSKQKARPRRKERTAEVVLRYEAVELQPPPYHQSKEPIALSILHLVEENAPEGVKPLEWFLLSTQEIASPEQAERLVGWYCLRWRIEDWHRVLKSGCKIEELRYETAERLKRGIAINAVIAWRIMLMTLLGRETPELPAEVFFSDLELEVLDAYAKTRRDLN